MKTLIAIACFAILCSIACNQRVTLYACHENQCELMATFKNSEDCEMLIVAYLEHCDSVSHPPYSVCLREPNDRTDDLGGYYYCK